MSRHGNTRTSGLTELFELSDEGCARIEDDQIRGIAVGEVVDVSTFPEVVGAEQGEGALRPIWVGAPGQSSLLPWSNRWRQQPSESVCFHEPFESGDFCVPPLLDVSGETGLPPGPFADSACSVPTVEARTTHPPAVIARQFPECPQLPSDPRLVTVHDGTLYVSTATDCIEVEREPGVHYLVEGEPPPGFTRWVE